MTWAGWVWVAAAPFAFAFGVYAGVQMFRDSDREVIDELGAAMSLVTGVAAVALAPFIPVIVLCMALVALVRRLDRPAVEKRRAHHEFVTSPEYKSALQELDEL